MATRATGTEFVRLEGIEECLQTLEAYPSKVNSVVKKALKSAVTPTLNEMKAFAHPKFRKIVKYKLMKGSNPAIKFGFFGTKGETSEGENVPTWFKAYWKNYGTLDSRFKGHTFERARKTKTKDWTGGVRPVLFFERSVVGKETAIYQRFQQNLEQEVTKLENGQ